MPGCSMDEYQKLQKSVDRLLRRYGKRCAIISTVPGEYNPDTRMVEDEREDVFIGRAIDMSAGLEHLPGTVVEQGEVVGFLRINDHTFTGELNLSMQIRLQGDVTRTFRQLQPIQPGDVCLYWKFVATA